MQRTLFFTSNWRRNGTSLVSARQGKKSYGENKHAHFKRILFEQTHFQKWYDCKVSKTPGSISSRLSYDMFSNMLCKNLLDLLEESLEDNDSHFIVKKMFLFILFGTNWGVKIRLVSGIYGTDCTYSLWMFSQNEYVLCYAVESRLPLPPPLPPLLVDWSVALA